MNTQEKKEMLLKLADELTHELGREESLYLVAQFKDSEYVKRRTFCSVEFVASTVLFYCQGAGMTKGQFNVLAMRMVRAYDKLIGGEFDEFDSSNS